LRAGIRWYDDPRAGRRLLDATRKARQFIADGPQSWAKVEGWDREPTLRRKGVPGFPYGIIYYVTATEIVIVAYAHERREPGYWMDRIT
jgi:plasmid stabilization system protein ParE